MSDQPGDKPQDLKDYADGWIQERKGTDVPPFLKLAYPVIGLFCVAYLIVFMNGEVNHSERGALVQKFNEMTTSSPGVMYLVAGLGLVYVLATIAFAVRKVKED